MKPYSDFKKDRSNGRYLARCKACSNLVAREKYRRESLSVGLRARGSRGPGRWSLKSIRVKLRGVSEKECYQDNSRHFEGEGGTSPYGSGRGQAATHLDPEVRQKANTWLHLDNPDRTLVLAVLEQGALDLVNLARSEPAEKGDDDWARAAYEGIRLWFDSKKEDPWDYVWCCRHLGISSAWFREQVLKVAKQAADFERAKMGEAQWQERKVVWGLAERGGW